MSASDYRFGPYRFDPTRSYLTRDGEPMAVGGRALDLLKILLERQGDLVTKEELIGALWPSLIVEDGNLSTQVWTLRKALSDLERPYRWIATVAGRGYRFSGAATRHAAANAGTRFEPASVPVDTPSHVHNLPARTTRLIGRSGDLDLVKTSISRHPVVSIVGAGGIGKTQLALNAAAGLVGLFPGGIWFVPLERLTKPDEIVETIASLFGLTMPAARAPAEILANFLRQKDLLIVLDNCEHLVSAVTELVVAILPVAPAVRFLATSREPLRVADEFVLRLSPLECPPHGAHLPLEDVGIYAAVALFVERAASAIGHFQLSPETTPLVVEICRRLDGVALAIELAAARLRVLSLQGLLVAIENRFRILSGGNRNAIPRQQTLEALIDWSYDQLSADEQRFFRRLAIFGGRFSLDATAAVAFDPADHSDAFELLASLVEKSLVVTTTEDTGRYRLFESMRAFGLARLGADETVFCHQRLTDYLIELFEQAEIKRRSTSARTWIDEFGPELDNLRVSLAWAFGAGGDPAKGILLFSQSSEIWGDYALMRERRRWLDLAASKLDEQTPPVTRARILYIGLPILYARRDLPANLIKAISILRQTDDKLNLALALRLAATALARDGDTTEAEPYLSEAEALARPFGLTRALLLILTTRATLCKMAGDFSAARTHHLECLALSRSLGNPLTIAATQINLAELDFAEGNVAAAIAGARAACDLCRQIGSLQNLPDALQNLAAYLLFAGDIEGGRSAALEAIELKSSLDSDSWLISCLEHLAHAAALDGDLETAARLSGYTDHHTRIASIEREATEQRGWMRLSELLHAGLSPQILARLKAEGQAWSSDIAIVAARGELTVS